MTDQRERPHQELADVPEMCEEVEEVRVYRRARMGRFLGPILAIVAYFALPAARDDFSRAGLATVSVGILMAVWWLTETLPLSATALTPIALFPLLGVVDTGAATPVRERPDLPVYGRVHDRARDAAVGAAPPHRFAYDLLAVGTMPVRVIGGFMLATAFLSMWVSSTATTVMMLPIGLSVLALVLGGGDRESEGGKSEAEQFIGTGASQFAICLMLGIAYAGSIGSLATLIGTPPNLFMAGFLEETYDISIGSVEWMLVGLPLAAVILLIAWVVLTRFAYPPEIDRISGGRELIRGELREMGPTSRGEKVVLAVFVLTAIAWVTREPLTNAVPLLGGLDDAGIAVIAAVVLFALPIDWRNGVFVLDRERR